MGLKGPLDRHAYSDYPRNGDYTARRRPRTTVVPLVPYPSLPGGRLCRVPTSVRLAHLTPNPLPQQ